MSLREGPRRVHGVLVVLSVCIYPGPEECEPVPPGRGAHPTHDDLQSPSTHDPLQFFPSYTLNYTRPLTEPKDILLSFHPMDEGPSLLVFFVSSVGPVTDPQSGLGPTRGRLEPLPSHPGLRPTEPRGLVPGVTLLSFPFNWWVPRVRQKSSFFHLRDLVFWSCLILPGVPGGGTPWYGFTRTSSVFPTPSLPFLQWSKILYKISNFKKTQSLSLLLTCTTPKWIKFTYSVTKHFFLCINTLTMMLSQRL